MQGKHTSQPRAYAASTNGRVSTSLRIDANTATVGTALPPVASARDVPSAETCAVPAPSAPASASASTCYNRAHIAALLRARTSAGSASRRASTRERSCFFVSIDRSIAST